MVRNSKDRFIKSKNLKYGLNSALLIVTVIVIAVIVNLFTGLASVKWDLTENRIYSIGDDTIKVLDKLDKKVEIYGLIDDGNVDRDCKEVKTLLDEYIRYSHQNISVKYIDPDKDTRIIKQLDPNGTSELKKNDFVVSSGSKTKKLSYENLFKVETDQQTFSQYKTGSTAEQSFTGAIKYVSSDLTPCVYFVEGHDEGKLSTQYKQLYNYIEKNNIVIKSLNLSSSNVPEDAQALVFLSPRTDISQEESEKLKGFLDKGGKAAFLFDYLGTDPQFPQFDNILKSYDISFSHNRVKENNDDRHIPKNPYAIMLDVQKGSIIPKNFEIAFLNSRSINASKSDSSTIKVIPIVKSSADSVGEQIAGGEVKGPLTLAVGVEKQIQGKTSRILAVGNASFLSDNSKQVYSPDFSSGLYFFLEALEWVQDISDDITIGSKSYSTGRLLITQSQANAVTIVTVIIIPFIILISGLYLWLRRRHA